MIWLVRKDLTVLRCADLGGNAQVQIPTRPLRSGVTHNSSLTSLRTTVRIQREWHLTQGTQLIHCFITPTNASQAHTPSRNCSRYEDVDKNVLPCGAKILVCVC